MCFQLPCSAIFMNTFEIFFLIVTQLFAALVNVYSKTPSNEEKAVHFQRE